MNEVTLAECAALRRQCLEREFNRMNEMQRQAVFCVEGPLLVLAGAGSGKTTVLVNRIANIIRHGDAWATQAFEAPPEERDLADLRAAAAGDTEAARRVEGHLSYHAPRPWNILAITFTNKAAGEMKARLRTMLGSDADDLWAGTFHSICAKLLRRHDGGLRGFDSHFAIYDTDDSRRVMKEVQRQLQIDEKYLPHKQILSAIGRAKDQLTSPAEYAKQAAGDQRKQQIARAYAKYQQLLLGANAMDFDDIICHTVRLLEENAQVREQYQRRFRYILVDEYQDTNGAQDRLVELLAASWGNLCVVGDDDQSIYKFRGAAVENILNFEQRHPKAKVIRLEQNYRSTQSILDAANAVIAHNSGRKGKTLWTGNGAGEAIRWDCLEDERNEAACIAETIQTNAANGIPFGAHAVLYRMNALSNTLETAFVRAGIPYRIIGGHRFYDRKEIKDMLAYLTVLANPADEIRLRRIINEPRRGVGETSVQAAATLAAQENVTLYEIFLRANEYANLSRVAKRIKPFTDMMQALRRDMQKLRLPELLEQLLLQSGYTAALALEPDTYEDRMENLQELSSNLLRYEEESPEPTLWGFLEEIALLSDIDQFNAEADTAVLMTLHSAKGLEFPHVFLPAWEERVFPSYQTILSGSEADLEEERRLAYVGITRAKEQLYFTTARSRLLYGSTTFNPPSRFLREAGVESAAPEAPVFPRRTGTGAARTWVDAPRPAATPTPTGTARKTPAAPLPRPAPASFQPGDAVRHRTFGDGVVNSAKAVGNDTLLEVTFEQHGAKKLMANYAKLEKIATT
ncbi:MAG: UvrD-helicase domain-containing protein [Oscillospiraceae bacterium]|jgi:DNA helicase-2/ATP-dependent DNA helicase PcrA|nr:UvrD-helicase domain-containing protein [Oscillospiraceae bacterium]